MARSSIYRPGTQSTTPEQRAEIRRRRWVDHQTIKTIAECFSIGESTVSAICNAQEDGTYEHNLGNGRRSGPRFKGTRTALYPRTPSPGKQTEEVPGASENNQEQRQQSQGLLSALGASRNQAQFQQQYLVSAKAVHEEEPAPLTPTGDALKAKIEFHRETLAALELLDAMSPEARAEIVKVLK